MELYRKVRLACRDGMSARAAARHFGVSRESVRKMLEFSVPPGSRRTAPVRRPKLDGFTGLIDEWLRRDRDDDHRKQKHTAKRIFDRLRDEHGFTGGTRSEAPRRGPQADPRRRTTLGKNDRPRAFPNRRPEVHNYPLGTPPTPVFKMVSSVPTALTSPPIRTKSRSPNMPGSTSPLTPALRR